MNSISLAKQLGTEDNVCIRVLDISTGDVVSQHVGHNNATNSMLTGVAHFLKGDGVLNQGYDLLNDYVPRYISLGTMGLMDQSTYPGQSMYPGGIGAQSYLDKTYSQLDNSDIDVLNIHQLTASDITMYPDDLDTLKSTPESQLKNYWISVIEDTVYYGRWSDKVIQVHDEILRYTDYIIQRPGYGSDGYDVRYRNNREYNGLGPCVIRCPNKPLVNYGCELIMDPTSSSYTRRSIISFRDVVPETESEIPKTVDVVYSAMISVGSLAQYRGNNDYIFITEAGLWSKPYYTESSNNGLLAGYRLSPPNQSQWDMTKSENRQKLRESIIRVGKNQVVQVIWKIQLGSIDQFGGVDQQYPGRSAKYWWINVPKDIS